MKHSKISAILWFCLALVFISILVNGIRRTKHLSCFEFPFIINMSGDAKDNSFSTKDKKTERFEFNTNDIKTISSNLINEDIEFEKGSSNSVEVYYTFYPSNKEKLSFTLNSATLEIKRDGSKNNWKNHRPASVVIKIPDTENTKNYSYELNCISGDIKVSNINAKSFDLQSVSGDVFINEVCLQTEGNFHSISGDVNISYIEADSIRTDSVSGDVKISHIKTDSIRTESISGDVKINSSAIYNKINLESSSGDIDLSMAEICKNLSAKVTSGDIDIKLPKTSDFTAKYKTSSGSLRTNFEIEGNRSGTISSGNEINSFELYSASGDIKIYGE